MNVRVIPRLDIKGPNLVKGIQLEGLRVLGKPGDFAKFYYEQGADELLYMDVVASLYERESLLKIVQATSRTIFIPLTVGGGLRSIDDIREVLRAGADKVALNSAALRRPELIEEATTAFGSSTVVVSIEAKRRAGSYEAYIDNGRERTGIDVVEWAREVVERGAGEIMVTSIDCEGTGQGFDGDLVAAVVKAVPVPVTASGGAGSIDDVFDLLAISPVNGVALASVLHYGKLNKAGDSGERQGVAKGAPALLSSRRPPSRIRPCTIPEIKRGFLNKHIVGRPIPSQ